MSSKEIWKAVVGRPDYEVSSRGRIRHYVKGHKDGDGYLCLSGGERGKLHSAIHHLVAEAFLGRKPKRAIVRHLNDVRHDNAVKNLAYGTRQDNMNDARRNGRLGYLTGPANLAHLKRICRAGGQWWRGKKRTGLRGKAIR